MSGPERARRDELIHRLRAEGNSIYVVAERANCSVSTAYEVLRPDRRATYNERRRRRWRWLAGKT